MTDTPSVIAMKIALKAMERARDQVDEETDEELTQAMRELRLAIAAAEGTLIQPN